MYTATKHVGAFCTESVEQGKITGGKRDGWNLGIKMGAEPGLPLSQKKCLKHCTEPSELVSKPVVNESNIEVQTYCLVDVLPYHEEGEEPSWNNIQRAYDKEQGLLLLTFQDFNGGPVAFGDFQRQGKGKLIEGSEALRKNLEQANGTGYSWQSC
ncbi:hypothetical protein Tco_0347250 [Tanacetum coccineum]